MSSIFAANCDVDGQAVYCTSVSSLPAQHFWYPRVQCVLVWFPRHMCSIAFLESPIGLQWSPTTNNATIVQELEHQTLMLSAASSPPSDHCCHGEHWMTGPKKMQKRSSRCHMGQLAVLCPSRLLRLSLSFRLAPPLLLPLQYVSPQLAKKREHAAETAAGLGQRLLARVPALVSL